MFFSLDHTEEVHRESQEINDPVWDCTLIKTMKEHGDTIVNPIYEWLDTDIWDYIKLEQIDTNPLYQRGYKRVGCIGCPMATYKQVIKEFSDYPQYKQAYIKAFQRMIDLYDDDRKAKQSWQTGEDVFNWWIEKYKHDVKGQMTLFEEE